MKIPSQFDEILRIDQTLDSLVKNIIASFEPILKNKFFFEEYTNHEIEHIEMVLKAAEFIIPSESFQYIQPKEVAVLILAILLHDIGMHTEYSTFKAMIEGEYDDVRVEILDKKTWKELWTGYLSEVKHWGEKQRVAVLGEKFKSDFFDESSLEIGNMRKSDNLIISEFIRIHHARLAHEVALKGLIGNETIPFGNEHFGEQDRKFVGIIARSHGMNIRDTFDYLREIAYGVWKNPSEINIVYLMVLLRIADYLQIDKNRTDPNILKLKTFNSPVSLQEHNKHLTISHLTFKNEDPELISVTAEPKDSQMYAKIQTLISEMQHEFDLSWAILGETYGFLPDKKPKIKFRRINSNLEHYAFLRKLDYVPRNINLKINSEVAKLLVAPLYGDNPTYGVRELVQNATDACKERIEIERDKGNINYSPLVKVSLDIIDDKRYIFKIVDNGKGMTLDEIQNYFLSVGSSFRKTIEWKKEFEGRVSRNGRFGIGVLAAFLLGTEISVKTKCYKEDIVYCFKVKLNDENVEIKKTSEKFDIGTKIEVLMSEISYYKLTKEQLDGISWIDWYVGEIPKVEYLLNGITLKPAITFSPLKNRFFTPKNKEYGKIRWEYLVKWKYKTNTLLACNDIIITLSYPNQGYNVSDIDDLDNYAIGKYIIIDKPCIFVEDPKGNLPLKLDRSSLDIDTLPFEDDLLFDLSKDFVAQLMMAPISINLRTEPVFAPHKTEFLYLTNGFTFASDYFINNLSTKYKFLEIKLIESEDVLKHKSIILSNLDEYVLIPYPYHTSEYFNILNHGGVCLFRKDYQVQHKYNETSYYGYNPELYPSGRTTNIYDYFTKDYRGIYNIEMVDDNYFLIKAKMNSTNNLQSDTFNINKWVSIIEKMKDKVILIVEIPLQFVELYSHRGGKILNKLFEEYIGSDVVIPYDIEKRVEKYPKAFRELSDYMKDYE